MNNQTPPRTTKEALERLKEATVNMKRGVLEQIKKDLTYLPDIIKKILSPILRFIFPSSGFCFKCRMPWISVYFHITPYTRTSGVFSLCNSCWEKLTPSERLPFYEDLILDWKRQGCEVSAHEINVIREAVLKGE